MPDPGDGSRETKTPVVDRDEYVPPAALPAIGPLYFFYDSHLLRPESNGEFTRLRDLMTHVPSLKVMIAGHASQEGTDSHNLGLSKERVSAVRDMLVLGGIPAARITTSFYGESIPAVSEEGCRPQHTIAGHCEEIRQKNRRVEVSLFDPTGRFPSAPLTLEAPSSLNSARRTRTFGGGSDSSPGGLELR